MTIKIVGIIGNAGVGKDTLADFFVSDKYTKMAMADPLKWVCKILFDYTDEELWGPSEYRNPEVRKTLQFVGTEIARHKDPDVWVKLSEKRIIAYNNNEPDPFNIYKIPKDPIGIVFSDIRFPNEARFLYDIGATLIKIERNTPKQRFQQHKSELEINNIPDNIIYYNIQNNKTIKDFYLEYKKIIETENGISKTNNN